MTPQQMAQVLWLIEQVGQTLDLEQTLDAIYEHARPLLACNRIGLALLTDSGDEVVARWAKSDRPLRLNEGFTGSLHGSTLQTILDRREVRIIDDLQQYLAEHPESVSTRLLVEEGLRSSLTCPLLVRDQPVGFLFFTSDRPMAYSGAALPFYQHVAAQLALVIEKSRLYSDLAAYASRIQEYNQQMNRELDFARHVQRMLVPASPPAVVGLETALWYQPVMQVGGDLVEFAPLPDGSLLVFVADAMGHGVQAALVMTLLKGMLASLIKSALSTAELMQQLNTALLPLLQAYFAVAMCAHVDPRRGRLLVSRAGIPPALLWQARTRQVIRFSQGGLPLAIGEEPYPVEESDFEEGDLLLIATDGLIEALDGQDQQFGVERLSGALAACAGRTAQDSINCILQARQAFCGSRQQADDMSLLAIRRFSGAGNGPLPG